MKTPKNKLNQVANYLEELSWLIESNKNISLKEASTILKEINVVDDYSKNNDRNKNHLVGILPKLLQDTEIFKSNSEMLDFAEEVLNLKPSRLAKRSRIEYIGWIVCEVANSNSEQLDELYTYLEDIIGNQHRIEKIQNAKKLANFSWNDAIRNINY